MCLCDFYVSNILCSYCPQKRRLIYIITIKVITCIYVCVRVYDLVDIIHLRTCETNPWLGRNENWLFSSLS